jgi:hypothetical protein
MFFLTDFYQISSSQETWQEWVMAGSYLFFLLFIIGAVFLSKNRPKP